jgi:hypothetical protein
MVGCTKRGIAQVREIIELRTLDVEALGQQDRTRPFTGGELHPLPGPGRGVR